MGFDRFCNNSAISPNPAWFKLTGLGAKTPSLFHRTPIVKHCRRLCYLGILGSTGHPSKNAGGAICRRRAANCTDFSTHRCPSFGNAHSMGTPFHRKKREVQFAAGVRQFAQTFPCIDARIFGFSPPQQPRPSHSSMPEQRYRVRHSQKISCAPLLRTVSFE